MKRFKLRYGHGFITTMLTEELETIIYTECSKYAAILFSKGTHVGFPPLPQLILIKSSCVLTGVALL